MPNYCYIANQAKEMSFMQYRIQSNTVILLKKKQKTSFP
jgi:hypothetical protein